MSNPSVLVFLKQEIQTGPLALTLGPDGVQIVTRDLMTEKPLAAISPQKALIMPRIAPKGLLRMQCGNATHQQAMELSQKRTMRSTTRKRTGNKENQNGRQTFLLIGYDVLASVFVILTDEEMICFNHLCVSRSSWPFLRRKTTRKNEAVDATKKVDVLHKSSELALAAAIEVTQPLAAVTVNPRKNKQPPCPEKKIQHNKAMLQPSMQLLS